MAARDVVDRDQFRIIYQSDPFPTTAYGIAHNVHPDLQEKIKDAFFTFDWEGTTLLAEFGKSEPPQEAFVPITFEEHWAVIRQIDEISGVSYACN
jgi:phosphonate transport system substrate-binding protein